MSSAAPQYEVGAAVLGYVGIVATWRRYSTDWIKKQPAGAKLGHAEMLTIQSCADTDDGAHTPAVSISICSREGLLALRDAINEALKEPQL